jgi:hypothetical protein
MKYVANRWVRLLAVSGLLSFCWTLRPACAQTLSSRVLALYPQEAGELAFVDLREARRSPYFAQVETQILPQSFRNLEQLAAIMGVDFNHNVDRLSWAYIDKNGHPAQSELVGVAEGSFDPQAVNRAVKQRQLSTTRFAGQRVFSAGTAENGREFVFAFTDTSDFLFGFRGPVQDMLTRAAQGGSNVMNNDAMRRLVDDVNRSSPIWMVLNSDFTQLGVRQLLADAIRMPGMDTMSSRVASATVRMDLDRGLAAKIAAHCATSADALWFSTLLQAALGVERQIQASKNPAMARVLGNTQVQRENDQVRLDVNVQESDLAALIQTNGLLLHF